LVLFQLRSRRQLDFALDARGTQILDNLNRWAGTHPATRPVHQTLTYFWGRIGASPRAGLRTRRGRRWVRRQGRDAARLLGRWVVAIAATGYLTFKYRHCDHWWVQQHGDATRSFHQVLEANLLGPAGLAISLGTVFIDTSDHADPPAAANADQRKHAGERKALNRWDAPLNHHFPQWPIGYRGDGIYACGRSFQRAPDSQRAYVFTFTPGRWPRVGQDFHSLLPVGPQQRVELETPAKVRPVYRWVRDRSSTDSANRTWSFTAIHGQETYPDPATTTWAWVTNLQVTAATGVALAPKGGRPRWHIEHQGLNTPKNSAVNREHASRHRHWQASYYLLPIAHLILQLLEPGNWLRRLAAEVGQTPRPLFGSLTNIARRLLERVRYVRWAEAVSDVAAAARIQIRLASS
jgi:hypothetical protein